LDDLRHAIDVSIERGRSRDAAVFYNNLSEAFWLHDGPQAALAVEREGMAFCRQRGIAEFELNIAAQGLWFVASSGQPEEALAEAERLVTRFAELGVARITVLSAQLRILAELGRTDGATEDAAKLASSARETTEPQPISIAFTAAALMLLAQGREDAAHALLQELEQTPAIRGDHRYAANLP